MLNTVSNFAPIMLRACSSPLFSLNGPKTGGTNKQKTEKGEVLKLEAFFCRHFYCYLKVTESGEPKIKTPKLSVTSGYSLRSCTPELTGSYKKSVFKKNLLCQQSPSAKCNFGRDFFFRISNLSECGLFGSRLQNTVHRKL